MFNAISSGACRLCRTACTIGGFVMVFSALSAPASALQIRVPEIDPASLSSGVTLLVGSALLIMGRRFKR